MPSFLGCVFLMLALLVVLALPLGAALMRKRTTYYTTPVLHTLRGHVPDYATLTPLDEPDSWRVDINLPNGKKHRFFIGADDVIKRVSEPRTGRHSTPWQTHDEHYPNFGTSISVMAGTKLEMVLLHEDANGTPIQVDFLLLFSSQIRISYPLT